MLLDEEKDHIRAEEIFRLEVRRKIEGESPKDSRGKRLWSLLNSSFALWFLSSVVLAGLTAAFTSYQRQNSERLRRSEVERRLNTEISSRISDDLLALRLEQKRIENGQADSVSSVYSFACDYLNNRYAYGTKSYDFSVYPEYEQRRFRSLLFELSVVADRSMLSALRDAEASYRQLEDLADQEGVKDISRSFDKNASIGAVKNSVDLLERLQTYPFWHAQL